MAEDNVIARVTTARADLKKMRDMVERCFAILCGLTGWNPKEGMTEDEIASENQKQVNPSYMSSGKSLVKLLPEDLLSLKRAQETVDAATIATCKMYAKKIAQLTHPDKIMRFSAKTKAELLDVFHHSLADLADNNHAGLVYAYVHVRILRGESRHVPEELYTIIEDEYNWTNQQIRHILSLKFIPAANAYCDGLIPAARTLFMAYVADVRAERKAKAEIAAMRAELERETAERNEVNVAFDELMDGVIDELGKLNDDFGRMVCDAEIPEGEAGRTGGDVPQTAT